MKKVFLIGFAAVFFAVTSLAQSVSQHLQDISVTIRSNTGEGSGVVFSRKTDAGAVNFVWTAGHVVSGLRSEREVISATGSKQTIVEFADARIVKTLVENGRTIGRLELDAEVIRYSNAESGDDLALLRLRKKNFIESTVKFYPEAEIPSLGTELYHVGSLLGSQGANSMTSGIYSQYGRLIGKTVYDQTTVVAFPGSSGGGVYLKNGDYVGMLVRGAGEGFNLIVPVRRIKAWAKRVQVEWALDESVPVPSDEEMAKFPIEDTGRPFTVAAPTPGK